MQKQIATIPKNAREELHVSLTEFKGHDLFDVRVFAESGDKWVATRKGITANVECLPAIVEALQRAVAEARAAGLLPDVETVA
jgi:Transcriptional Coactivator p15 (PC4)